MIFINVSTICRKTRTVPLGVAIVSHGFHFKRMCCLIVLPCLFACVFSGCTSEYRVVREYSRELQQFHEKQPYLIGCGDRLKIVVWNHEDVSADVVVQPDGKISIPLVGDIQARGLTVEALRNEINTRMSEFIFEPSVSVAVSEVNSLKVYILGEVNSPGPYTLDSYTDVLTAIAEAGGFTIYAKKDNIQILRTIGQQELKIKFNYSQVIRGKNIVQNIPLRAGDVVIVP